MGAIEETRQVLQDFLAPELRALAARVDALEKHTDARFDALERQIDASERTAEKRHHEVIGAIGNLANYAALAERVARIESERRAS